MLKDTPLQKQLNVLVIGESCIDVYLEGLIVRKYSETKTNGKLLDNVPIFEVKKENKKKGMASNVVENFLSLGHKVKFLTNEKIILKKRFINQETKEHIIRADFFDSCNQLSIKKLKLINLNEFDFIVFSDYNKGLITKNIVTYIRENFKGVIYVDSKKKNLTMFKHCIVKINETEYSKVSNFPNFDEFEIIITKGAKGACHKEKVYEAHPIDKVIDICGAGDNFLAGFTIMFHSTKDFKKSIHFANYCASICLSHVGVNPISKKDLKLYVNNFMNE
jgi:bifunctional ADP-heptose synthase (sugar kinase/adenylyltransferase)